MSKKMTDIEIAKAEVKRQQKHREDNFHLFREGQDVMKKKKDDIADRLLKNKYV